MEEKTIFYQKDILCNYQYEIVNDKSTFVMCGYYWGKDNVNKNNKDGLTYGQLAQRLIKYCKKNKCNYFLAEIPQFAKPGGYQIAINFKPTFILETLPIIYPRKAAVIDTDMTVTKYPSLFDMDYDFMGFNWLYEPHQVYAGLDMSCFDPYVLHTSGGMLVFNNTTPSYRLLREWKDITDKNPGKAEDRMLSIPFNKNLMLSEIRCLWLPVTYFYIPYFYEIEDVFDVPRKFRKAFKHIKNFDDEHTFEKFFNMKFNKDIYIHHPESLTSEEQAALQGASNDRIPIEFYSETGKKLKCLNGEKGLVNMPELYCNSSSDKKAFSFNNKLIELYGFAKLNNRKLNIKRKGKYKILSKNILPINKTNILLVLSNYNNNDINIGNIRNISFVTIDRQNCDKSYLIYSLMKKYKMNVLFLENEDSFEEKAKCVIKEITDIPESYDFACINMNNFSKFTKCDDKRSLSVLTTNILYFANNKFGINLLKLWNNENKKNEEDKYTLSATFNKHMYAIYSRCKWLSNVLNVDKDKKYKFIKYKYNLYDYFVQCADRRPLRVSGEIDPYGVHYVSGKKRKENKLLLIL